MTQQPTLDRRRLVCGVVVDDQMELKPGRHRAVNGVEELAKLKCPVAAMKLSDHLAGFEIERGKQVGVPWRT